MSQHISLSVPHWHQISRSTSEISKTTESNNDRHPTSKSTTQLITREHSEVDSGALTMADETKMHTDEPCTPDGEEAENEWRGVDMNQSTIDNMSSWMEQVDASDELKRTMAEANNKRYANKLNFLQIPVPHEGRSLTREGTPMSNYHVPIDVPSNLSKRWKKSGDDAVLAVISALYAKFLVVMGLAFPMTEVISNDVTASSYLVFYLYLYFGCIAYFFYVFISMIRHRPNRSTCFSLWRRCAAQRPDEQEDYADDGNEQRYDKSTRRNSRNTFTHHGSFYLRIGAVAFGVGSMIYSGLEFAQYFEIDTVSHCRNVLMAFTPAARMIFTFIQMYFIFLNAKMSGYTHRAIAYFGLMHMVATNLCVWLNVIIEETKHEILHFLHHNVTNHGIIVEVSNVPTTTEKWTADDDDGHAEALVDLETLHDQIHQVSSSLQDECKRSELMGTLVQDASPLLFPCAIEYSLICAAILYVMWKNVSVRDHRRGSVSTGAARRSRHHYSVDCAKANKGLFFGIFVLVMTIISLIMFFALINHPSYREMAIVEVGVARFGLFAMTFLATLIGIVQVRELRYDTSRHFDLDDVLLIFGQIGLMAYNIFTVIAGYHTMKKEDNHNGALVLLSALAALFQAVTQTLFILDASRRNTYSADQQKRKPGREVVTFLLVANFAMWTVNTLEKSRADANPVQLQFYGLWPWIIITNVSMPLAIFYRFHSTVVLCEIWKRCYKAKPDYYM